MNCAEQYMNMDSLNYRVYLLLSLLGSLTCKYMTKKKLFTTNTIMDPKWARCERDLKNHARHLPIFNIKNLCEQTY